MVTSIQQPWPYVDLRSVRLTLGEKGTDGFHRSWIPILPEGEYEHPQWGTLPFTQDTLTDIKQNFDDGARGIEIALDYDHKASEGDSKAPGWIERVDFGENIGKGDSPEMRGGLWAYVRWTKIGLADIKDQIYRYVSAEVKPDYHNDITGKDYKNVLVGATLTNRPFMKNMPAIELAEVSTKSWASVNKSKLPRSCFIIKGDPKDKGTWHLPIYEGAGPLDADGHYTQRGALNINGVRAAVQAIGGARTGTPMSGIPGGTVARLQGLLKKYSGGGGSQASQKASEPSGSGGGGNMTRIKTASRDGRNLSEQELLSEFLAERQEQRGGVMLSSNARSAKAKMSSSSSSSKTAEPDGSADDGEDDDGENGGNATGNAGAKRANGQGSKSSQKLTKKLAAPKADNEDDQEGEYAEDDNWSDQNEDGDGSSQDGKRPGAVKAADGSTADDEEMAELDEGANMDGIDEELDADDDDSDALGKFMPKADLTGPKAVTGRATAPSAGAGKHNNVTTSEPTTSSDGTLTLEEARTLREELAAYKFKVYEGTIKEHLAGFSKLHLRLSESQAKNPAGQALAEQQVAISKRFRDRYKAFMLSDGYRLSESTTAAFQDLIKTALEVAIVDLSRKGSSMDFEERKTIRASDAKNGSAQDQHLVDAAEMIAQRDYHISLSELRVLVKEGDTAARDQMGMVYRRAAKESDYQGH